MIHAVAIALVALSPTAALAEVLKCVPSTSTMWLTGEAHPAWPMKEGQGIFTIDLKTGAYHQDWTDGTPGQPNDATYEIRQTGHYGDEADWVGWEPKWGKVIRIRLTNEELQFVHDYWRRLDIGTCTFVSREGQYE